MRGVSFPEQTTVYGKPEGWKDEDCYGLPVAQTVYTNSEDKHVPCLISYWEQELTDAQIEEIVKRRKVGAFLSVTGIGMQPVSISIDSPFGEGYDKDVALENYRVACKKLREGRI